MSEHDLQVALVNWCHLYEKRVPELGYIFAVPNGGMRARKTAMLLKAEGVRPGIPDLLLLVPRKGYHGLAIEMKFGKNELSGAQASEVARLERDGYDVFVCWSWEDAARHIAWYLDIRNLVEIP